MVSEDRMVKETFSESQKAAPPKAEPAKESQPQAVEGALFQCPNCNGMVKDSDTKCPHCGAMFVEDENAQFECPACSTLVNADATKCPGCGALFVEDESAADTAAAAEPQLAAIPAPVVAPVAAPAAVPEAEPSKPSAPETKDEELERILSTARRIKEERAAQAAAKPAEKKFKKPTLGFLRGRKEEPAKPTPAPSAPSVQKPTPAQAAPEPSMAPAASPAVTAPPVKREFPTDPREQGKELARLVAEVRALLGTATERDILIDESKDLLDRAITAGRERQFVQALEIITQAQEKLQFRLKEYVGATFISMRDEIEVAKRLGGNPSRAEVFLNEATRAAETPDYQASLVFIDKAKNELAPITGKYNETREALRKFERLVKDARVVGIDTEPLKLILEDAKRAFDSLDFPKTEALVKKSTDEVIAQIPDRMNKEIEKAKQMLVEAKMKSDAGVGPQITILKSAIKDLKEEKYLEALSEMKRFKKEMRKILSPA